MMLGILVIVCSVSICVHFTPQNKPKEWLNRLLSWYPCVVVPIIY
jgi:hypothetical protein